LGADSIFQPVLFFADAAVTGVVAWWCVRASGHGARGWLEAGLAWLWSFVALIVGAGVILGIFGGFGALGFFAFHALVLVGWATARRKDAGTEGAALVAIGRQCREFFNTSGSARWLGAGLLAILAVLTVIAAWAEPAVVDALTYHLPRIGGWLQDGEIKLLGSADARLNFVAGLPDIVMAWLIGGGREGFRMVVVAQALGGILAVGATVGLARESGLGRSAALLAGGLLLGMGNVAVQFTAAQTDLFTTGVFAVAFYLWLVALRRGESSWLGVAGAGLALGAKGTLFYLAPGAVLWVAWLAWQHRLPWVKWRQTLVVAALGIGLFALPGFVRNWRAYGDPLGPAMWVKRHHQGFDSVSGQAHKLAWNVTSSLAQNLEPQSQPFGLREAARSAGLALVEQLPAKDPYTLNGMDRRGALESILRRAEPDADVTSFGAVTAALFLAGTVLALVGWRRGAGAGRLIVVWSAGVVVFLLFFHAMQQWHHFAFRYFVLAAPWVAIVAAWGIEQWGRTARCFLWSVVMLGALNVGWHVTTQTHQAGWRTVKQPERSLGYFAAAGWREWSQQLDHAGVPLTLALPEERPIAAFYRQRMARDVLFKADGADPQVSAEEFVRGAPGWVVVPASRFIGREGRVAAGVWLLGGDETNAFSVAAYRTLAAGEKPAPIFYRQRRTTTGAAVTHDLLVKTVGEGAIRVQLGNPLARALGYAWSTPLAQKRGTLAAGERLVVELPLPPEAVGEVKIVFETGGTVGAEAGGPTVEILR
jgi:hypothetical protein